MNNSHWLQRSTAALWHPCTQMKRHRAFPPVPIARASGSWLYDFDGHRYLDAVSSWWVNLFGHAHPRINAAIGEQLGKLEHVMLAGLSHQPVIELAERLAAAAPPGLGHTFFASDGASSTEIALKMSFHFWRNTGRFQKQRYVSLSGGYHGETLGALGVTDVPIFRDPYAAMLRRSSVVQSPDWRFANLDASPEQHAVAAVDALDRHLAAHHQETAALIVEPLVQGAAGMGMYHPLYLRRARELCDLYSVHLIADEIMTGFGRTGTMFACEQAPAADEIQSGLGHPQPQASVGAPAAAPTRGIRPDFLCVAKGLTGGYLPLSAVLTTDRVFDAFYSDSDSHAFLHSHSYTGNPLACSAALAVLDIFRDDNVIEVNRQRAARWDHMLEPLKQHRAVTDFRRCGMIWAFEVDSSRQDFSQWFFSEALKRELLLRPIGNTVYIMPPYTLTDDEMTLLAERALGIIEDA